MIDENNNPYRPSSTEELLKAELQALKDENEELKASNKFLSEKANKQVFSHLGKLTVCNFERKGGKITTSFEFGKGIKFLTVQSEDEEYIWSPTDQYEIVVRKTNKTK